MASFGGAPPIGGMDYGRPAAAAAPFSPFSPAPATSSSDGGRMSGLAPVGSSSSPLKRPRPTSPGAGMGMGVGMGTGSVGSSWGATTTRQLSGGAAALGAPRGAVSSAQVAKGYVSAARAHVDGLRQLDSRFPRLHEMLSVGAQSGNDESDYTVGTLSSRVAEMTATERIQQCAPLPGDFELQAERCTIYSSRGVFPEINRAWQTIDSSIYLWDMQDGSDFCIYEELDEVIVCAALVKPKRGVFRPAIEYLLVLATPVQVYLIGVEFTGEPSQFGNMKGCEINFDHDPVHTTATDNVVMSCITGTPDGRIFMGGRDGSVYELKYQRDDGWLFSRKCRKINHTTGALSFLLPSLIKSIWTPEPILQLAIDESRQLVYCRTATLVQIYRYSGDQALAKQEELSIGREAMRGLYNDTHGQIVSIIPLSSTESPGLGFMAVTNKGVRVYFGSNYDSGYAEYSSGPIRPQHVRVLHDGLSPPTRVHSAWYQQGTLLLASEKSADRDELWTITISSFQKAAGVTALRPSMVNKLQEEVFVDQLPGKVFQMATLPRPFANSRATASVEHNPLFWQHLPAQQIMLLTSKGALRVTPIRPVDQLRFLLGSGNEAEVAQFFCTLPSIVPRLPGVHHEEPPIVRAQRREACAACLIVACSLRDSDVSLQTAARDVFNRHGGEPLAVNSAVASEGMFGRPAMGPQITYSGKHDGACLYISRLVYDIWREPLIRNKHLPVSAPFESALSYADLLSRSRQLTLVSAFLEETGCATSSLSGVSVREQWQQTTVRRMMEISKPRTAVEASRRAAASMPALVGDPSPQEQAAIKWKSYFQIGPMQAKALEKESFDSIYALLLQVLEGLHLWAILVDTDFTAITGDLKPDVRDKLRRMSFGDYATSEDGTKLARAVIDKLLNRFSKTPKQDEMSARLHKSCPTLHNEESVLRAKASAKLLAATIIASSDPTALKDALQLYLELYRLYPNYDDLPGVCNSLKDLKQHDAIVTLALECASHPALASAVAYYRAFEPDDDVQGKSNLEIRNKCYTCITDALDELTQQMGKRRAEGQPQRKNDPAAQRSGLLKRVLLSDDELAHIAVFDWYMRGTSRQTGRADLMQLKSRFLEDYLKRNIELANRSRDPSTHLFALDSLSMYYRQNARYLDAAKLLVLLAEGHWPVEMVDLQERVKFLSEAVTCAKGDTLRLPGAGDFLHTLEAKMEVALIQLDIFNTLQAMRVSANPQLRHRIDLASSELQRGLKNITDLHDDFTSQFNLSRCTLAIVYCAAVSINLEDLWRDVIEDESNRTGMNMHDILRAISTDALKYRSKNAEVPLRFLVESLELLRMELPDDQQPDLVFKAFLRAKFDFVDLFQAYDNLHSKQLQDWSKSGRPLHLFRVIYHLLDKWRSECTIHSPAWYMLCKIADGRVTEYLTELRTHPRSDQLLDRFRRLQRNVSVLR